MRRRIGIACLVALLSAPTVPARADLVVTIGDATVAPGGTGTLDVFLSSTAPPSAPDSFNDYSFQLRITPITVGNLAFSASQDFGYLNRGDYVFAGNSADYDAGLVSPPPIGGTTLTTVYSNDTFLGFDNTNDFGAVTLSSSSHPVLLAALTLDASITSVGEAFVVSLVPPKGDGSSGSGAPTYFNTVDSAFNELSAVHFTGTSGTVTIGIAVPEPSSGLYCLSAIFMLACYRVFRRGNGRQATPA